MTPINLRYLYAMEVFSGLSRGSFLVCIGWTTLIVSGEVARVGQVFLIGMLTNIVTGPLLGTLVDRFNRKSLAMIAHLGIGFVMIAAGVLIANATSAAAWVFFVTTVIVYVLRLLYHLSHDGLIRSNVAKTALVTTIARARTLHLLATAAGTVVTGVILEQHGPLAGFALSGLMSLLLILPVMFIKGSVALGGNQGILGFFHDLVNGFAIILRTPVLRLFAALAAITLPVGQLSNAILSSFIHRDLGYGGDVFGLVDSAWPLGGMAAAAIMSVGFALPSMRYGVFIFAICAGLSTIAFAFCTTVPALVVTHGAMCMFVWYCHILIDAQILRTSDDENIGRVKAGVQMGFSIVAAIMCLSPTITSLQQTSAYFLFWGGLAVIGSIAMAAQFWMLQETMKSSNT